jgi:hypothetical protein
MVIADNRDAVWLRHAGEAEIEVRPLPLGLSLLTTSDLNDKTSPRIRFYRPRFEAAAVPDPERGDWGAWEILAASQEHEAAAGPRGAMTIVTETAFGTVSSSMIALPSADDKTRKPIWRFCHGRPGTAPYKDIVL